MNESETPESFAPQSSFQKETRSVRPANTFNEQFQAMESRKPIQIVDALLKRPAALVHELIHGASGPVSGLLFLVLVGCLGITGFMMGTFSGGNQLWAVPGRIILGTLAGSLICMPSLYILLCLSGGRQHILEVGRILLLALTMAGLLFIGFIPVAWLFSQATESTAFMGVLYLIIWSIGLFFGLRLMQTALEFLNGRPMGALRLWMLIFCLVLLQMSTTLRPIIGPHEALQFGEKKFFLTHWFDQLPR